MRNTRKTRPQGQRPRGLPLLAALAATLIFAAGNVNPVLAKAPRGNDNRGDMQSDAADSNRSAGSSGNFHKSRTGNSQGHRQSAPPTRTGNRDASGNFNKSNRFAGNIAEQSSRTPGVKGRQNDSSATGPRYVPKNNLPATQPKTVQKAPLPIQGQRFDRNDNDKAEKNPSAKLPATKIPNFAKDNKSDGKPPSNDHFKDNDRKGGNDKTTPHKDFKPANPIGKGPHGTIPQDDFSPKGHSIHKPLPPKQAHQFSAYGKKYEPRKPVPQPHVYRGPIAPKYTHDSFRHHYYGPKAYIGIQLYPRWSPWVEWSWGYRCRTIYDPRPIVCRPVVYRPVVTWVYWATPVWTPLPDYCGTWTVMRPAEPVAADDLQLLAVRFIDPGHPDQRLGPRYRVWFRNNGAANINRPFDVMLFAANDERLSAELPRAGVRVAAVAAGAVQSVDIRLPFEVYSMNRDAAGNPAPFAVLHVLVDAANELPETDETNNGVQLSPGEILPIDPAAFDLRPETVKVGDEVDLAGEGFGPQPGRVLLIVAGAEIDAEIVGWYDLGVRFVVPAAAAGAKAEVIVVREDGTAANPLRIAVLP
jgi:hypothetical protein